ncbi:MAG: ribonuclease H-like domain-containing protein [Spirochaetia bacterium]
MKDDLYSRFLQIKKSKQARPADGPVRGKQRQNAKIKDLVIPGWERIGEYTYLRVWETGAADCGSFRGKYKPEDLVFIDSETTGLSGAGTVIFLMGMGVIRNGRLTIRQYFLSDYPGEPEFLSLIHRELPPEAWYVSYNGKAFDCSILKSRFLLNRLIHEFPNQLDLLHLVRKFWKTRIGSCSLSSVEQNLLSIQRDLDVPGAMVPDYYFSYLNSGDPRPLLGVFEHHRQDIHTLLTLLNYISKILTDPLNSTGTDAYQLGKYLLQEDLPGGRELLERQASSGHVPSGFLLSLYYKRAGMWEDALRIWNLLMEKHRHVISGIESAKYWEHREKQPQKALAVVEALCGWPEGGAFSRSLNHRRDRLLRKLPPRE